MSSNRGVETLLFNLPTSSKASAIAMKGNNIYVVTNLGLHHYIGNIDQSSLLIMHESLHGLSTNGVRVVLSDANGLIFSLEGKDLVQLSGSQQDGETVASVDGFSKNASHAQADQCAWKAAAYTYVIVLQLVCA